jgi:tRNA 5-methylaminomethyl-2-thiouridine biosynthesis bifunctional protein
MQDAIPIDVGSVLMPSAGLEVRAGVPWSRRHAAYYHHPDGVAEREQVFLGLNALPERFAALPPRTQFHLGELGFGTGLTVLLATRLFLRSAPADCSLHVTSMEAAPLRPHEWAALSPVRQDIGDLHALLVAHAPPPLQGWHRRWLHPRVRLSLYHGDALAGLEELRAHGCGAVDAWCLDGFAPERNPEMWSDALAASVGALSGTGTTLATFSAAGTVRRALRAAGFAIARVDGAPRKWHYLRGDWRGTTGTARRLQPPPPAHIVGAGIAGSLLAQALHLRGGEVTIEDTATPPPGGASANPATALQVRLPRTLDAAGLLRLHAYAGSAAWLGLAQPEGWTAGGVLHLGLGRDAAWLADFAAHLPGIATALDAGAAADLAGLPLRVGGVLLPGSGRAHLPTLCRGLWPAPPVLPGQRNGHARLVIAAPAAATGAGLRPVPGTVTLFSGTPPTIALSGDGYVLPTDDGGLAAGGTYDRNGDRDGDSDADARNARRVVAHGLPPPASVRGRFQGVRWTTADRQPLVGPTGDPDTAAWLCTGFASSGLSWAWLAAEVIASEWCGEPPALSPALRARLLPARLPEFRRTSGR